MVCAYEEYYLDDAKNILGECIDYIINDCGFTPDLFSKLFVNSSYSRLFERGNSSVVAGMTGIELAMEIISETYRNYNFPELEFNPNLSKEYWAGWALAEYQWMSTRSFYDIFSLISMDEIIDMYYVYHQMDILHFVEDVDKKYKSRQISKLKWFRELWNLTQEELSKLTDIEKELIQQYETDFISIDNAPVKNLYKLSIVLHCNIEDLLMNPVDNI